jgi:hypothetical protein
VTLSWLFLVLPQGAVGTTIKRWSKTAFLHYYYNYTSFIITTVRVQMSFSSLTQKDGVDLVFVFFGNKGDRPLVLVVPLSADFISNYLAN